MFMLHGIVWCWRSNSCFRLSASLPYMSICARIIVSVTFQKIDHTPYCHTCTNCGYYCFKSCYCCCKKCHSIYLFLLFDYFCFWTLCPKVHGSLFSCILGMLLLPVYLPTVKGFIHLCIWSHFHVMQMLHIFLNVKGIFRVIIRQLSVSFMLRYIKFV